MGKYFNQYKQIHKSKKYGFTGKHYIEQVMKILPVEADSVLDYGAGQSDLAWLIKKQSGIEDVAAYDPCVEGRDVKPNRQFDFVTCTDVMEHVPEEEIDDVLTDIWSIQRMGVLFVIALRPAGEILPNGENAHCSVHDAEWWRERLLTVFERVEKVNVSWKTHCIASYVASSPSRSS